MNKELMKITLSSIGDGVISTDLESRIIFINKPAENLMGWNSNDVYGIAGMIDLTLMTHLNMEQKDNLITAKYCAESLLRTINNILDCSKMEAGMLVIEIPVLTSRAWWKKQ